MANSELDNFGIIKEQLSIFGGRQKPAGEWRMVVCPFHNDRGPSCGVYMRRDDTKKKLGFFNCLGCGTHGPWNVFAEKTGLQQIKEWNSAERKVEYDVSNDDTALLSDSGLTMRAVYKAMNCPEAQPWPVELDWRGIKGALISAVGGRVVNDEYNDSLAVLFPIKMGRKIRGAVKAVYQKKTKEQLGYITMNGEWVSQYGLFPYDYTSQLIRRMGYNFIILVEGPRDALRLLKMGLPALAVLGANTIGKTKMLYVKNLGVENIYVMPDNDNGGTKLWQNIKQKLNGDVKSRRLKLPVERDENNKIIKMDPFSAPYSVMKEVKILMTERHGWVKEGQ